jgi:hypothetical protein
VVNVPSGFTHVDDVSDRCDSTSTRDPCARAATRADNKSGRLSTRTAFGAAATDSCATATAAGAGSAAIPNVTAKATTATIAVQRTPRDL